MDLGRQVQTDIVQGNCWQTAIACVLEVPAADLPCQLAAEKPVPPNTQRGNYNNDLQKYLTKHWRFLYTELYQHQFSVLQVRNPGTHLMIGPTVRTATNGGLHHVVVAQYGEMVWDPHPSGAGLTQVLSWGVMGQPDDSILASWDSRPCPCPACKEV